MVCLVVSLVMSLTGTAIITRAVMSTVTLAAAGGVHFDANGACEFSIFNVSNKDPSSSRVPNSGLSNENVFLKGLGTSEGCVRWNRNCNNGPYTVHRLGDARVRREGASIRTIRCLRCCLSQYILSHSRGLRTAEGHSRSRMDLYENGFVIR